MQATVSFYPLPIPILFLLAILCFIQDCNCFYRAESDSLRDRSRESSDFASRAKASPPISSQSSTEDKALSSHTQLIGQLQFIHYKIESLETLVCNVRIAIGISSLGLLTSVLMIFFVVKVRLGYVKGVEEVQCVVGECVLKEKVECQIEDSCLLN